MRCYKNRENELGALPPPCCVRSGGGAVGVVGAPFLTIVREVRPEKNALQQLENDSRDDGRCVMYFAPG